MADLHANQELTHIKAWFAEAIYMLSSILPGNTLSYRQPEPVQSAFGKLFLLPFKTERRGKGAPPKESYTSPERIGNLKAALEQGTRSIRARRSGNGPSPEDPVSDLTGFLTREVFCHLPQNTLGKNEHYETPYFFLYCFFPPQGVEPLEPELQQEIYELTVRYFAEVFGYLRGSAEIRGKLDRVVSAVKSQGKQPSYLTRNSPSDVSAPEDAAARLLFDALLRGALEKVPDGSRQKHHQSYWAVRRELAFRAAPEPAVGADQTPILVDNVPISAPDLPPAEPRAPISAALLSVLIRHLNAGEMTTEEIGSLAEFLTRSGLPLSAPVGSLQEVIRQRYAALSVRAQDIEDQTALTELLACRRVYALLRGLENTADP